MPKRSSSDEDDDDPILAAHRVMQRVIEQGAYPHPERLRTRVIELERLCGEVAAFAAVGGLPARVVGALRTASRGLDIDPTSLLPITPEDFPNESAAVALGRAGGLKGGKARADALSGRRRKEIAKKAAKARWAKPKKGE